MKKITILTVLAIVFAMSTNATVWRVNSRVINGLAVNADFTTLQDAINGTSSGDTLYLEGSPISYGDGVFDKQLTVIGTGYWLEENDTTQAYKQSSNVGLITFESGSEGSIIEGIKIEWSLTSYGGNIITNLVTINVDFITIKKSYFYSNSTGFLIDNRNIFINGDRTGINIHQNWIHTYSYGTNSNGISEYGIYMNGNPSDISITNNFIRSRQLGSWVESNALYMETLNNNNDVKIYNNVMWGDITTYYSEQINNIWLSGTYNGAGDQMMNNLCNGTQYPDMFNNQQNVDMTTVFVDYDLYIDNGYVLASGSPAIGAGINGGDCGVFGYQAGGIPYVLSGLPAVPAIFETTIESYGENSVSVTIKGASHNASK